jgi:hypothetical protein
MIIANNCATILYKFIYLINLNYFDSLEEKSFIFIKFSN